MSTAAPPSDPTLITASYVDEKTIFVAASARSTHTLRSAGLQRRATRFLGGASAEAAEQRTVTCESRVNRACAGGGEMGVVRECATGALHHTFMWKFDKVSTHPPPRPRHSTHVTLRVRVTGRS